MAKFARFFLALMILALACTPMFAHPAQKVELKWDEAASLLHVSIVHPVKNTANHYISKIVVSVDGKVAEERALKSQSDSKTEQAVFEMKGLKKGARIEVEVTCNVFGKLKENMVI